MNNFELYKEFYFHEINRKHQLNGAVNIPILIITAIISIHLFLFKQDLEINVEYIGKILSAINLICILISLFYLAASYSNLFMAHKYREIADMGEYRKFETNLITEQERMSKARLLFEDHLILEFSECAKENFLVNKKRTENLANSKKILFIGIFLTITFSLMYIISIV